LTEQLRAYLQCIISHAESLDLEFSNLIICVARMGEFGWVDELWMNAWMDGWMDEWIDR